MISSNCHTIYFPESGGSKAINLEDYNAEPSEYGRHLNYETSSITPLEGVITDQNAQIQKSLQDIQESLSKHDLKAEKAHENFANKMEQLERENKYFRNKVSAANSPDKLKIRSFYIILGAAISLGFSIFCDINLVHPILSVATLSSAIIFHIMALIMKKQDGK